MRSLLVILCILLTIKASAIHTIDSVGIENNNGNQVILHKVAAKESYYSIARLYKVSPKDVIAYNNNIALKIGMLLKVPTQKPFSNTVSSTAQPSAASATVIAYTVGPKETLYAISKKFNTSIDELKQLNNLKSTNLSLGQVIKVPVALNTITPVTSAEPSVAAATQAEHTTSAITDTPVTEKPKIATGRLGLSERSERGVAVWIADENVDGTKMLALHRTAPVGTVVKITNPMTERSTFAKVVGKFTENESTKDVIIVITKATADLLGALDKRFQVNIDYGVPNE